MEVTAGYVHSPYSLIQRSFSSWPVGVGVGRSMPAMAEVMPSTSAIGITLAIWSGVMVVYETNLPLKPASTSDL